MKSIANLLVFLFALNAFAQNPIQKEVDDFTEIKVFDLIAVNLIKADENRVEITGDDIQDVEVINKNGKLKIRMKLDKSFNGERTFVSVYYTNLEIIDANEGAYITANELIEQDQIALKAQEGARLKIGLDVDKVNIRAVTGGIVETRGRANSQDIVLNTGGIYEGKDFETKTTKVDIKAAGEANVNASENVDARVIAGGDVYIYGNPQNIKEKTTFGGRIQRMR
ncbi:DUF2807 domain-containing protein [Subsaximicrobium wynnwilliamsii]|uniref:DUF2807 domain-containing protein n=1 Tax=Subsaximicrobium wynnwilliamsii TaxID=291179 RepID=A0A5C6ZGM5_9FLAO|nr:head GIN domain-containing protein [Subsaximicrobium wynnwilliamsii]TXD82637.1 DUF2807 domain-containing protein [Subsaximicrobium wynnwilliamsii]TXD88372.1 DUF2807 domain-containing protein [Subsaximicrobium wynnwilliamsii]TXE02299.1 DUF2807 domain-containing protein [Subsaximicrobium wynnwilliamsii]